MLFFICIYVYFFVGASPEFFHINKASMLSSERVSLLCILEVGKPSYPQHLIIRSGYMGGRVIPDIIWTQFLLIFQIFSPS